MQKHWSSEGIIDEFQSFTHQICCRMLWKPHRGKAISAAGQKCDNYVDKRNPISEVGPETTSRKKKTAEAAEICVVVLEFSNIT